MIERQVKMPLSKAARNERRKAFATTCNALAVAVFISAIVQPIITGQMDLARALGALVSFIVLQGVLHYILAQVED